MQQKAPVSRSGLFFGGCMQLSTCRYHFKFKRPFTTAHGTRTGTDAVLVKLEHGGQAGYGEAAFPPYLGYTQDAVYQLLNTLILKLNSNVLHADELLDQAVRSTAGNNPALAAMDMAIHDLLAKISGMPTSEFLGVASVTSSPPDLFTIATHDAGEVAARMREAPASGAFKIKLTGQDDLAILDQVLENTDRPIFLDINQGWRTKEQAEVVLDRLVGAHVLGIEQPFNKENLIMHGWLNERTEIPVIADESLRELADLDRIAPYFQGVNVKLMKCGGLRPALEQIKKARDLGLFIMLGSMSESTCGTQAAMQLAGIVDLLDQDGPMLLENDPFMKDSGAGTGVAPALQLDWNTLGTWAES